MWLAQLGFIKIDAFFIKPSFEIQPDNFLLLTRSSLLLSHAA